MCFIHIIITCFLLQIIQIIPHPHVLCTYAVLCDGHLIRFESVDGWIETTNYREYQRQNAHEFSRSFCRVHGCSMTPYAHSKGSHAMASLF